MQFISDADMENLPPPPYLIEHVLPAGALAALVGGPGGGKTFVALDMAFCVATGTPWLGHPVQQGPVAYVMAEGTGGLPQRLRAWKIAHSIEGQAGVFFQRGPVQLLHAGEVQALLAALEQLPATPVLIVIDTLARCFVPGDENSAQDMGRFIAGADAIRAATGATVLVVHHTGWETSRERGSTALRGAADTVMMIQRLPKDASLRLTCEKQKDAEPFEPVGLWLQVVELQDGQASCVVQLTGSKPPPALPPKCSMALKVLDEQSPMGATFKEWLKATGLPKATFNKVRQALTQWQFVKKDGSKYSATQSATDGA